MMPSPSERPQCPEISPHPIPITLTRTALFYIFISIILILAQVVVFNHICLFGMAVPFVFIYLLIILPFAMGASKVITIGFILGLIVDIFSDTAGLYALGCTIMAGSRLPVIRLYFPREEDLTIARPSVDSIGLSLFLRYSFTLILIFCTIVTLADSITFFSPMRILLLIIGSTLLTSALIVALDFLTLHRREKRL